MVANVLMVLISLFVIVVVSSNKQLFDEQIRKVLIWSAVTFLLISLSLIGNKIFIIGQPIHLILYDLIFFFVLVTLFNIINKRKRNILILSRISLLSLIAVGLIQPYIQLSPLMFKIVIFLLFGLTIILSIISFIKEA